jgi:hypothetical protein
MPLGDCGVGLYENEVMAIAKTSTFRHSTPASSLLFEVSIARAHSKSHLPA